MANRWHIGALRLGCAIRTLVLGMAVLAATASPTRTQTAPASLIADQVTYDAETGILTASGNVEVYHRNRVLRARRIAFDQSDDSIVATGPVTLTDPDGSVLIADGARLSADLRTGLVEGARLLVEGQLQIAANELRREDGRFTTMTNTVASSCTICIENPTPTWSIRASRITQDEEARRIYFENARVEALGLPIAYLPRLSIPDPSQRRASGFLLPSYQQSNIYGFGFKQPYYRVIDAYSDATITPFVTTKGSFLLEGEYRQRFSQGGFDFFGTVSLDDGLGEGPGRGFITTSGDYRLPTGFVASFDVNLASDESFLQQFDYSDADRLTSTAGLNRTRARDDFALAIAGFQSLREDEDTNLIPLVLPEFSYRRRFPAFGFGDRIGFDIDTLGIVRDVGVDMLRGGGGASWRGDWILAQGLVTAATAEAPFDVYQVWNDVETRDGIKARIVPGASVELRWPLVRDTGGAAHVVEPIAQVVYSAIVGDSDVPNEDSRLPELDETNLFSLNRFPGRDRWETGLRANLGVSYTRYDPTGWSMGATLGRVLRSESVDDFAEGTGLAGKRSDYVGAISVDFDYGLTMVNRALFDDKLTFRRNEFALGYDGDRGDVSAAYVFLSEDNSNPVLGPQPETNEFLVDARYRVRPNWEIRGNWRYDVVTNSPLRAGGGVTYGNECAEFDLSVSRRFTSSTNVPPSTSFRFGLRLAGLGGSDDWDWPARECRGQGT